jgi:uncharacterized repeat protein (TIGR03803 family)
MPSKRLAVFVASFTLILGSLATTTPSFAASAEKILYNFCSAKNCADGQGPTSPLILGTQGNLYGMTAAGGTCSLSHQGCGTVFELMPSSEKWTEKVLYSFCHTSGCTDGWFPYIGDGLVSDSAGNLYGMTYYGGTTGQQCYPTGCGTVFELIHDNAKWKEKVLFRFCSTSSCPEGGFPMGSLIFDAAGNLYGVTHAGGANGYGTVFELTPNRSGQWRIKVLHDFNNNGMDGYEPWGSLVMDKSGNLYGTTATGGTHLCDNGAISCGIVFELIPNHGQWVEKVLHDFDGTDGAFPQAGLTLGATGELYGTTSAGGSINDGTAFELSLNSGNWVEKVLYSFNQGIKDYSVAPGASPWIRPAICTAPQTTTAMASVPFSS